MLRTMLMGGLLLLATAAQAADGYKLRFPLSGTLGAEIIAPLSHPGLFGTVSVTQVEVNKATGNDGHTLTVSNAGTTPPSDALGDSVLRSASYAGTVKTDVKQSQTVTNLVIGHLSQDEYLGGRLSVIANLSYASLSVKTTASGATPTLSTLSPDIASSYPAGTAEFVQAQVQSAFANSYQAGLASQSAAGTGSVAEWGDAELTLAWVQANDKVKLMAGATLALPTGQYSKDQSFNVGFGHYYTLRPGVALAYQASDALTLGVRASLGLNSRNTDNQVRTGNFAGLDLAGAYRTPVGVVGVNLLKVAQYQDDTGGTLGANRFSATAAGLFLATLISGIDTGINLSYTQVLQSRNAMSGSFLQVVLTRAF